MTNELSRVSTLHQAAMGVVRLPLEIQQQIFALLDVRSFYAARNVCKWWRYASIDATTLAAQLHKMPVLLLADPRKSTPMELHELFDEAAYTMMLGTQIKRKPDTPGSISKAHGMGYIPGPKVTVTARGDHLVTLNYRMISLFDTSGAAPREVLQRPLNDLKERLGDGPWLKVSQPSYYEIALSSDANLLAIAQERTIQIYDLSLGVDSLTVNEYISDAAGHYICGLDFQQDDYLLRVRLNGKSNVLYLGAPPSEGAPGRKATLEHWRSPAGLKNTFLDTALLLAATEDSPVPGLRLAGLQLLRPFQNGYLFASQRHGGNESSHYVLGHVRSSRDHGGSAPCVDVGSVTILTRLESFLSAWSFTVHGVRDSSMGQREDMPSAHEHHPRFALSPNGLQLALVERDKKCIRPMPLAQLFMYRLPCEDRLLRTLEASEAKGNPQVTALSFLDAVERKDVVMDDTKSNRVVHTVSRIPICLSTTQGAVTSVRFDTTTDKGKAACALSMITADVTKTWTLSEM